jgi:hypothetical protein
MKNNTALVGDVLPLNAPKQPQSPIDSWFQSCDNAAKKAPHKSPSEWVNTLQDQLKSGKQKSLNMIFAGLDPQIKKALYMAAHLKRDDLPKDVADLTGAQRQQVFIALQRFEQLIVQMQKAGVFSLAFWEIGKLVTPTPVEQEEIDRLKEIKRVRYDLQRQQLNEQHGLYQADMPQQKTGTA